jgi:hypothetical protein
MLESLACADSGKVIMTFQPCLKTANQHKLAYHFSDTADLNLKYVAKKGPASIYDVGLNVFLWNTSGISCA